MVTTFYPPYNFGGDGIFVYRLSNALAQRGHGVDVVHCVDAYKALDSGKPCGQYPNHPNVTVHSLKSRAGILSPLLTQQLGIPAFKGKKIQQILDSKNFDVINFHNVSLVGGPKIFQYGKAIKLYTTHEYWLLCPTHALFKFNREACVKPSCFSCCLIYKRPPQLWRYTGLLQKAIKHIDAFIAPSWFAADMHRRMGLQIPITRIPMFLPSVAKESISHRDDPKTNELIPSIVSSRPYFLFVGRLEKLKGLQEVIPLFEKYEHADLLVAGAGTFQHELQNLAKGNPRIKFVGYVPYEVLQGLYLNALALIVPSICYETFGQVILEAFMMKTPVIVKEIGAMVEIVTDSGGGLLYREQSDLQQAIEELRTNTALRWELGNKGYKAYLQYGTEERYLEKYFQLISEIENRHLVDVCT